MEKMWSSEADVMDYTVQRWMSVDHDDGDVVREVANDRLPGSPVYII